MHPKIDRNCRKFRLRAPSSLHGAGRTERKQKCRVISLKCQKVAFGPPEQLEIEEGNSRKRAATEEVAPTLYKVPSILGDTCRGDLKEFGGKSQLEELSWNFSCCLPQKRQNLELKSCPVTGAQQKPCAFHWNPRKVTTKEQRLCPRTKNFP